MQSQEDVTDTIIAIEKAGLDRWGRGDPDGFLEICAPDVVYFDPYIPHRIDGYDDLKQNYDTIRGQVQIDQYELIDPIVQCHGDIAVLTFNYRSTTGDKESRWNCTEVYRRMPAGWRIIQTHWSYTQVFEQFKS